MKLLQEYVRELVLESYADIAEIGIKVRMKVLGAGSPSVMDVLTDIRAIEGVITVKQAAAMTEPNFEGYQVMPMTVNFVPDIQSPEEIIKKIRDLEGVDMVKLYTLDGNPYKTKVV